MKRSCGGVALIELIVAIGLGVVVISVGCSAYFGMSRSQDRENRREEIMLSVQNAMARMKSDVRGAHAINASDGRLLIDSGRVVYRSVNGIGLKRTTDRGTWTVKGVYAEFTQEGAGVKVTVRSSAIVHKRPLQAEVGCYVAPRN